MPCPVTSSEERALLRAIKDSDPEEDAVRFVYADFLLDQGREAQANFVRWQTKHHQSLLRERIWNLTVKKDLDAFDRSTREDWLGRLPSRVSGLFFRGLLELEMSPNRFFRKHYGKGIESCRQSGFVETISLQGVQDQHVEPLRLVMRKATERLAVSVLRLSRTGFEALADVSRLERLCVDYGSNELLVGEDMALIAKLVSLRDLYFGQVQTAAFDGLGHLASLTGLRKLVLVAPELSDEQLAPVCELPGLVRLDLHTLRLTDASLDRLRAMKGLRHLRLGHGAFSVQASQRLREALPKCEITGLPSEA